MSDLWEGIIILIAIAGLLLYFATNRIHAPRGWYFHDTWFDEYIPLVPYFVIPYVGLYPYIIVTVYLVWSTEYRMAFFICAAIAAWTAALTWYLAPAGIMRNPTIRPDFFSRMVVWLYEHDQENNTFPSSHVFYAVICSYFLILAYPAFALLFAILGVLISVSTVLVKQHHAADIVGGIIWAVGSIVIANFLIGHGFVLL